MPPVSKLVLILLAAFTVSAMKDSLWHQMAGHVKVSILSYT